MLDWVAVALVCTYTHISFKLCRDLVGWGLDVTGQPALFAVEGEKGGWKLQTGCRMVDGSLVALGIRRFGALLHEILK